MFQKRRHRMDLLEDHIHFGVNFFATSQEIVREWQVMGEETLEFEAAKKALAEEREKFNAEKKQERVAHQKRESEYLQWIAKLQQLVKEKSAEVRALEIIVEEANADSKWLLARGVLLIVDRIMRSEELATYMYELGEAAYDNGRKDGYGEGRSAAEAKEAPKDFGLYKTDCVARYAEKWQEFEFLEFAIVIAVGKLSRQPDGVELLKKALGDQNPEAEGAGPSH
ncbi:hypothetical protein Hanom_Chr02g00131091 [Helianthus anomalus]